MFTNAVPNYQVRSSWMFNRAEWHVCPASGAKGEGRLKGSSRRNNFGGRLAYAGCGFGWSAGTVLGASASGGHVPTPKVGKGDL